MYFTALHYSVLNCIKLLSTLLYFTTVYCTLLYFTMLYRYVLYFPVLYLLYVTVRYCIVLDVRYSIVLNIRYCNVLTERYSTVLYCLDVMIVVHHFLIRRVRNVFLLGQVYFARFPLFPIGSSLLFQVPFISYWVKFTLPGSLYFLLGQVYFFRGRN